MQIQVKTLKAESQKASCIVVGVYEKRKLSTSAAAIDKASNGYLSAILKRGDLSGEIATSLLLHEVPNIAATRVLLVGCGKPKDLDAIGYRKINTAAMSSLQNGGSTDVVSCLTEVDVKAYDLHWKIRTAVETSLRSLYRFDQLKSKKQDKPKSPTKLSLAVANQREVTIATKAARIAVATNDGKTLTSDLANLPGNICNPTYLADQAKQLSKNL